MLQRPRGRPTGPGRGRQQAPSAHKRLALALAVLLVPWAHVAAAASQPDHQPAAPHVHRADNHLHHHDAPAVNLPHDDASLPAIGVVADALAGRSSRSDDDDDDANHEKTTSSPKHPQHAQGYHGRHTVKGQHDHYTAINNPNYNNRHNKITTPNDASALATLAPAQPVRAPHPPKRQWPRTASSNGLSAAPQAQRSLEDWEVEDFVLLATIDGDLYASDRRTGRELWHLEVDQPMIDTRHHRANSSVLDDDYEPIDHYIWAVEPVRDGAIYVWIPDSDVGLARTSFTMKRIVEDLAPFADEDPPVVYTGDKKTTLITLDAATGRVLKWFGAGGSHVNQDDQQSCLRPSALYNMQDRAECSSTGTITLGRTEYTVGIQRRDGRPIATLRFAEWVPNNYDNDLQQQYHTTLDSRYITSQHDGKVYAFDYDEARRASPRFKQTFAAPVARVFDVCRPWDAPSDSNPELVLLPQPPMPSHDQDVARMRSNSIFLNCTAEGSWYAMSGRSYPLIIDAPTAEACLPDWDEEAYMREYVGWGRLSKSLIGTHLLDPPLPGGSQRPPLSLGGGDGHPGIDDAPAYPPGSEVAGESGTGSDHPYLPVVASPDDELGGLVEKVKSLPQSAANSILDFISNPTLIIVFIVVLVVNEHKLRRSYQRFRTKDFMERFILGPLRGDSGVDEPSKKKSDDLPSATTKQSEPDVPEYTAVDEGKKPGLPDIVEEQAKDPAAADPTKAESPEAASPEKKKKAHRGRRGGVKHRKGAAAVAAAAKAPRDGNSSQGEDPPSAQRPAVLDDAVTKVMRYGGEPSKPLGAGSGPEPNIMTVQPSDMQAVGGPIVRMGNIEVDTDKQLGSGSNGTLVFAGKFDGREVAVKRMLIHFYDIASQETKLLRESDDHPNVIRYYSQQAQDGFLYIALERCAASLAEVIEKPHAFRDLANAGRMDVPAVLYQIANGINHLHSLRIVHRDLKPQNILVNMGKNGKPRMLVSDFGLCKKLEDTQSSFGATTGRAAGTSGWRAPELLVDDDNGGTGGSGDMDTTNSGSGTVLVNDGNSRRATRAIDIFSLGLVFFYVLTNGLHPFDCGDRYMREVNIRNGKYNLKPLDSLGDFAHEAKDLIGSMLRRNPRERPTTTDIMSHPFFWSAKKRLAFLCDVSDHFEKEPRDPPSAALTVLEDSAAHVISSGDFLRALPRDFVDSLGKQRKYTGSRFLDLLRALRNKRNHYEDMPDSLKRTVGPLPEGYLSFWSVRFPMLLLACWNVVWEVGWDDSDRFREYYLPAGL